MLSRASKQGVVLLTSSWREVSIPSLISSAHGFGRSFASSHADVHSTTVLCVRKDDEVVLVADGQVTMGGTVVKPNVKKTRKIGEQAVGGFAGATADAFTLFERLETKLEEHPGQLTRAAVELAKMWRMDKYLRRLDAALVVADKHQSLQITGNGDVLEPHDGIIAIGSGSPYALAAARALIDIPGMDARTIAQKAMSIAADVCIYTNTNFTALSINGEGTIEDWDIKAAVPSNSSNKTAAHGGEGKGKEEKADSDASKDK